MSLTIRMRRALSAFKADPFAPVAKANVLVANITVPPVSEDTMMQIVASVAKRINVPGPREVADELIRIAQYKTVPMHVRASLRVEAMNLHRWMDLALGKREGDPTIYLNPKRK